MLRSRMAVAAVALSLAFVAAPARAHDADVTRDVRITAVSGGAVTLYDSEHPDGVAAEPDVPLEQGDRIVTGDDSTAELAFDGGSSVVTINANSDFTLQDAQRASTVLGLASGSLLAKIEKLLEGESLQVQAPAAVAAVRGTEFGVEAEDGAQSHVGVFDEGRVEVSGESGPPQILQPNQETTIVRGAPAQPPRALQRFLARRAFMRKVMRARVLRLARGWKRLSPAQRRAIRRKAFLRMHPRVRRELRQRLQQRRRQRQRQGRDR